MGNEKVPMRTSLRSIEVTGQMDPDTFAELLRPWPGNGRTRGPALELILKNEGAFVPDPITGYDMLRDADTKEGKALYMITIEGGRGGVGVRMTISFLGAITLLDQLDDRWREPGEWQTHRDYAGFRFRSHERRLIESTRPVTEYVPVTVTLAELFAQNAEEAGSLATVSSGEAPQPPHGNGH